MCDGNMGGGVTLIVLGGKMPLPPGLHELDAGHDMEMGGDDAELGGELEPMPKKRPMMGARALGAKREIMKPRKM